MLEKNVSFTINSDAHQCNNIDNCYFETVDELKKLGVKSVKMLIDNSFKDIDINKLGLSV